MRNPTIDAPTKQKAAEICLETHGFYPDAVRQVDSGNKGKAWMCFENSEDARIWDNQR